MSGTPISQSTIPFIGRLLVEHEEQFAEALEVPRYRRETGRGTETSRWALSASRS